MGDGVGLVFDALADPRRRTVIEQLAAHGSATPTTLAGVLPVTRQAVAKHLATLTEAGLVRSERRGREVWYAFDPTPLAMATDWMERVGATWDARLDALARHVATGQGGEGARARAESDR